MDMVYMENLSPKLAGNFRGMTAKFSVAGICFEKHDGLNEHECQPWRRIGEARSE